MSKILYTLALSSVLAVASPMAFAQGPELSPKVIPHYSLGKNIPSPCVMGTMRQITLAAMPMLESSLNLTDTQKTAIRDVLTKADQALIPLNAAQKKAAQAFTDALVTGASEEKLTNLAKAASEAENAVLTERVKSFAALREQLTDQQKQLLSSMMQQATTPWRGFAPPQSPSDPPLVPVPTAPQPVPAKPAAKK